VSPQNIFYNRNNLGGICCSQVLTVPFDTSQIVHASFIWQ